MAEMSQTGKQCWDLDRLSETGRNFLLEPENRNDIVRELQQRLRHERQRQYEQRQLFQSGNNVVASKMSTLDFRFPPKLVNGDRTTVGLPNDSIAPSDNQLDQEHVSLDYSPEIAPQRPIGDNLKVFLGAQEANASVGDFAPEAKSELESSSKINGQHPEDLSDDKTKTDEATIQGLIAPPSRAATEDHIDTRPPVEPADSENYENATESKQQAVEPVWTSLDSESEVSDQRLHIDARPPVELADSENYENATESKQQAEEPVPTCVKAESEASELPVEPGSSSEEIINVEKESRSRATKKRDLRQSNVKPLEAMRDFSGDSKNAALTSERNSENQHLGKLGRAASLAIEPRDTIDGNDSFVESAQPQSILDSKEDSVPSAMGLVHVPGKQQAAPCLTCLMLCLQNSGLLAISWNSAILQLQEAFAIKALMDAASTGKDYQQRLQQPQQLPWLLTGASAVTQVANKWQALERLCILRNSLKACTHTD